MAGVASDNAELARQLEDMREQQRAIGGVLRAVARSAGIQPVLDEVVEASERLCRADYGALYLLEHGLLHVVAHHTDADAASGTESIHMLSTERQPPAARRWLVSRSTFRTSTTTRSTPTAVPRSTTDR